MPENPLPFQPLYHPRSVEELLTEPTIRMLMLGFTTSLESIPVALYDVSGFRYDLSGEPGNYWSAFCRTLRKTPGMEDACLKWDQMIADFLLGRGGLDRRITADQLEGLFECHAHMLDVVETIRVGGKPFAVLNGGQIYPNEAGKAGWKGRMEHRLRELLAGRDEEVKRLIDIVERDSARSLSQEEAEDRLAKFRQFARDVEILLNKLYQERRAASEESLLKSIADALMEAQSLDWPRWWNQLSNVLSKTNDACRLSRIGFLLGSNEQRFNVRLKAAARPDLWRDNETRIGHFWEIVRHRPMLVADQPWAPAFRRDLSIGRGEACLLSTTTCQEMPQSNLPAVLVFVGADAMLPGMPEFCARLIQEIGRTVTARFAKLAIDDAMKKAASLSAISGHDLKSPLHAAMFTAESLVRDILRLGIGGQDVMSKSRKLIGQLAESRIRAAALEQMPVTEMTVECILARADIMPVIEQAMDLARGIALERGVTVKWERRTPDPVNLDIDEDYLSIALAAVFDNAVKYSFKRKEVRVSGYRKDGWFVLEVTNYGIGIPPLSLLDIFDLGRRAQVEDQYQGYSRRGSGLGLPRARSIIAAHQGDITLTSIPPDGVSPEEDDYQHHVVCVRMRLPLPSGDRQ